MVSSDFPKQFVYEEVLDDITEYMAGKAAFEIVSGKTDIGTGNDFENAFERLRRYISDCCTEGFEYGNCTYMRSERQTVVVEKVHEVIGRCYEKAVDLIKANRLLLDELASRIFEKKIIFGDEINEICASYRIRVS